MKKIKVKSWYCETKNKFVVETAINSFQDIKPETIIRENDNRTVFRIKILDKYYYIKLTHPAKPRHKIRELFYFTKSYQEFQSAEYLKKVGIDIVDVIGWGKKYSRNFLITEDAGRNTVNALSYWLKTAKNNSYIRKEFLKSLSFLLRKCLYANFFHPDFHLGNLLLKISSEEMQFIFVDPAGIKFKTRKMDVLQQGVAPLIADMIINDLKEDEAVKFLIDSNIIKRKEEFGPLWIRLRKYKVKMAKIKWGKRKKKLFRKTNRFACEYVDTSKNRWYLRKDVFLKPVLQQEELVLGPLLKKYRYETLSYNGAIKKWMLSFYLELIGIPIVKPLAFYTEYNKQESVLIYEHYEDKPKNQIHGNGIERLEKLCETADYEIKFPAENIVYQGNTPLILNYEILKKA